MTNFVGNDGFCQGIRTRLEDELLKVLIQIACGIKDLLKSTF